MKNSNNKILSIAVILLLLTNIALVIFMVKGKDKQDAKRRGNREPFEMMVKELNMTEQQQTEYKQLKDEHLKNIKPLFDSVRAAKTAFFGLLKDPSVNDSSIAAYSQKVNERQAAIDKYTFTHFRKVRNLFTAEQQPRFDEFIQKMMQRGRKDSSGRKKD